MQTDSTPDLLNSSPALTQLSITSSLSMRLAKREPWRGWQGIFTVCVEELCLYQKTHEPNGETPHLTFIFVYF